MHSGVIEIKALQLECQQVGKVQKSQTLCREALISRQGRPIAELSSINMTQFAHLPGITFLFASFTEVLIGPIQGFWLDKCLQSLFLWQKKLFGPFRRRIKYLMVTVNCIICIKMAEFNIHLVSCFSHNSQYVKMKCNVNRNTPHCRRPGWLQRV